VDRLVRHCAGRVRYWQCDNEPSNVGLLWAGTAAEYVAQLKVMYRAVKDADPDGLVVLGGAPFGLPESPPDSPDRQFFDVLLADGRDAFDLFDLHLYGEASRIPADIETARGLMRALGYEKPLVAGEYNAPRPNLYPEAVAAMQAAMAAAFAAGPDVSGGQGPDGAAQRTPEQAAMASLYERMPSLPPQLQMFMRGCPPGLEARRRRINCREIVMRNLLALASGVRRTICWNLAPEIPGYEVRRRGRGPLLVVWDQRDSFSGEDDPPVAFDWPWPEARAAAVDAFGQPQPAEVRDGRVHLEASITPLLVTAG